MKYFAALLFALMFFSCSGNGDILRENTHPNDKSKNENKAKNKGEKITRKYKKTGWIAENRYRALVYIVTEEECKSSSKGELENKIKNEAVISLHRSFNRGFNPKRNGALINLINNYGKLIIDNDECLKDNVYILDIIKEDLRQDLRRIKNIK